MAIIPLPNKIKWETDGDNKAKFIVEPCTTGYGVTLGNALRRVLLSSLAGAAVTRFKIKKVDHEFSTIPGIKEDVVQIMMNLKGLRVKSISDEPVKIYLKVKGKTGEVKASDIEKNAEVEVINKDHVIATITDKKTDFNVELTVEKGLGYVPVEEREDDDREVGAINLDAFYSPVKNVGFEVESARVGQNINYDRLILAVDTDGSITSQEAVNKSLDILLEHFNFLKQETEKSISKEVKSKVKSAKKLKDSEKK